MSHIDRKIIALLMLGETEKGLTKKGVGGITRLQKYLFLLENEEGIKIDKSDFDFEPYKAGPYSSKLYDDLEFLENLGFIESSVVGEATEEEAAEIEMMSFDYLINDYESKAADAYQEKRYFLTENGIKFLEERKNREDYKPALEGIRKIKSKFGHYSLKDLLFHVYKNYPEMTVASEIREKILQRRTKI